MAIPFNWPSEEDTEEYYRRLDQLLADLYDVLRHILIRPRVQVNQQPPAVERGGNQHGGEPPEPPGGGDNGGGDDGGGSVGENSLDQRIRSLPDVVADADQVNHHSSSCTSSQTRRPSRHSGSAHRNPRRHRSRRRSNSPRTKSCCALKISHSLKTSSENWIFIGQELRKIAEEFRTSYIKEERTKTKSVEDERQIDVKASSLFSLLVPAQFSGSIWTTVIILVGWKLLMRNR